MAFEIEKQFEDARSGGGPINHLASSPFNSSARLNIGHDRIQSASAITLADLCDRFLNDPTSGRTSKSASVYRTTYAAFLELIGPEIPVGSITRAVCRDALSVLQYLPPHARKRWPTLTLTEISSMARVQGIAPMSPANTNEYMNKLATLLNWAVKEELILRNPA
ncbi:MAG: phage integrase SAM-like domain-containing protein [Sphingopyxis sp.]|nr:phage integrase SAM-like domain-containing protein [Sphingopyxis sp.]